MKRRSFLAGLLGLPAVPLAAKALEASPVPEPVEESSYGYTTRTRGDTHETRTYEFYKDFIDQTGPTYMTSFDDLMMAALPIKKTS